jgi:transcriptional regulator with XRE-family HTH domain
MNWSSGRSSPTVEQVDEIAYRLGVQISQLLIEDNTISLYTPPWQDGARTALLTNLGRLRLEKDIHEDLFNYDTEDRCQMSYRTFLRYIKGTNSRISLDSLDRLSKILSVKSYKLLEFEVR